MILKISLQWFLLKRSGKHLTEYKFSQNILMIISLVSFVQCAHLSKKWVRFG